MKGVLPGGSVSVVDVKWHGSAVVELTYKDESGHLGHELRGTATGNQGSKSCRRVQPGALTVMEPFSA